MKLYLLYYCEEDGSREEWSVFYTPCEIFTTDAARQKRKLELEQDEECDYKFHTDEVELND